MDFTWVSVIFLKTGELAWGKSFWGAGTDLLFVNRSGGHFTRKSRLVEEVKCFELLYDSVYVSQKSNMNGHVTKTKIAVSGS